MSQPTTAIGFSPTTPAAGSGYQNTVPQTDNGAPLQKLSESVPATGGVTAKTANYTAAAADCGTLVSFTLSGAATYTLPATPPSVPDGGGTNRWKVAVQNQPASTASLTISATSAAKLDGVTAGTLVLPAGTGVQIYTDGTNYFTERGANVGGGGAGGVSAKTGNYTAVLGDSGTLLSFNSASAVTLTLPSTPPNATWNIAVQNVGAGVLTINRNSLNIDGAAANLTVNQGSGIEIFTDGTNYFTERGVSLVSSLTTTGTSGPATLSGGVLNIPQYSGGGGGGGLFSPLISIPTISGSGFTTAYNQSGTFAAADSAMGITLNDGAVAGDHIEGILKAYPTPPFTATALLGISPFVGNFTEVGFSVAQNATSGLNSVFGVRWNTGWQAFAANWNNTSGSFNSYQLSPAINFIGVSFIWLRLKDDGTNITFYASLDGVNWKTLVTFAKSGSFLAGNYNFFGFAMDPNGFATSLTVASYTQTSP